MNIMQLAQRGTPLKELTVIDCHAHLGQSDLGHVLCESAADMVRCMDALGVDACVISSFLAIGRDPVGGNDEVAKAIRDYPGRFIGYAGVNPRKQEAVIPELERCFDNLGMTAVKLHPVYHGYIIQDPICVPVFEFADERRCPVLCHDFGDPGFIKRTAETYPNMKLIPAHVALGGPRSEHSELLRITADHENIFLDPAFSRVPYRTIEKMVEIAGEDKVLYGSDSPFLSMSYQIGKVLFADIDDSAKRKILGENAVSVFGLEL